MDEEKAAVVNLDDLKNQVSCDFRTGDQQVDLIDDTRQMDRSRGRSRRGSPMGPARLARERQEQRDIRRVAGQPGDVLESGAEDTSEAAGLEPPVT